MNRSRLGAVARAEGRRVEIDRRGDCMTEQTSGHVRGLPSHMCAGRCMRTESAPRWMYVHAQREVSKGARFTKMVKLNYATRITVSAVYTCPPVLTAIIAMTYSPRAAGLEPCTRAISAHDLPPTLLPALLAC